jgi:membrane protein
MAAAVGGIRRIWTSFNEDKAYRLAASITNATIFALAPLIVLLVAIGGSLLGGSQANHDLQDQLLGYIRGYAGPVAADQVRKLVEIAFDRPNEGLIAKIVGWVMLGLGASGLFNALQDALNAVWHIEGTKAGWRRSIRSRLVSAGMIAVVAFLLIVSLAADGAVAYLSNHYIAGLPTVRHTFVLAVADETILFVVVTIAFAVVYKVLPAVELEWRDVWFGAAVTSMLFLAGEGLIALYITVAGIASAYGAAGALLVVLTWIYYSSVVLLLGAEFTKVRAGRAKTVAPSRLRELVDCPAGVDPRRYVADGSVIRSRSD